ncbi:MAG TPA: hypothetical protein VH518_23480, partial [Tepidisphaeraceae bacterium]
MRRRLFTLLSAVSLLLCVATVGLWVRSYWVSYALERSEVGGRAATTIVYSQSGSLGIYHQSFKGPQGTTSPSSRIDLSEWDSSSFSRPTWHGFWFERSEVLTASLSRRSVLAIAIPHWLVSLSFAILPSCWLLLQRKRRLLRTAGRCKTCGYDLRATPERCP